jgi:two-component system sensor histidine kinase YesM
MSLIEQFSFKHKIFISYSLVVVIIMMFVTMALYLYIKTGMEEQQTHNMAQIAQKTGAQIDEFITNMSEVAIQTGLNPVCVEAFARVAEYPATKENRFETTEFSFTHSVMRTLATFKTMHFGSGRISLYDEHENYMGYGIYENSEDRHAFLAGSVLRENAAKLRALDGKPLIILPHKDYWNTTGARMLLSVLWKITDFDSGGKYGYVEVQQAFTEISKLLPLEDDDSRTFLFSSEGERILPDAADGRDNSGLYAKIAVERSRSNTGNGILYSRLPERDSGDIVAWTALTHSGWILAYTHDTNSLFRPVRVTGLLVFFAGLLVLLLGIGVVFLISGRLSAPIRNLRVSLAAVDLDNLEVNLPHDSGDDDVSCLNEAFASMFDRLKKSTDQLILSRNHEVKAHLLALQSQVDPHFIFNILSVISASARDIRADRISEICSKLAAILRYVSDFEGGLSTIEDEIAHARTYIELMKYRFEGGLDYSMDEAPHARGIQVPKFFLQPVVENCFKHGFSQKRPPWNVAIRTSVREEFWYVEVEDNGLPISASVIAELNRKADAFIEDPSGAIHALKIGGLGLFNSLVRLRLLYGADAVFRASSNDEGGTRIVLGGRLS